MKGLLVTLGLIAVVAILAFGSKVALATDTHDAMMAQCQDQFKSLDIGGKGYLTYEDFKWGFQGAGDPVRSGRHIGVLNSDRSYGAFTEANTSRDGELTLPQFCAYKTREFTR